MIRSIASHRLAGGRSSRHPHKRSSVKLQKEHPVKSAKARFYTRVWLYDDGYEYEKPHIEIPTTFHHFCEICATGSGMIECENCNSRGFVYTRPGGAGMAGEIGRARCRVCLGMGVIPCPLCGGGRFELQPPRDPHLDFPQHPFDP